MSFVIVELIQYFFLQIVLDRITGILKFFSTSKFLFHRLSLEHSKILVENPTNDSRLSNSHVSLTNKNIVDEESLQRDDMEVLMTNLGVFRHFEDEKLPQVLNSNDLFDMFEQEQPRLDEVKEAFGVFDENKDGFIDAHELQRVLCVLGLKESANMEDCKKMIGAFDENADGRIDLNEFVKVMENTYC